MRSRMTGHLKLPSVVSKVEQMMSGKVLHNISAAPKSNRNLSHRYISIDISYENLCDIRGKSGFKKSIRSLFAKRNPDAAKYNWNDTAITRDNQVDCLKHLLGPFKMITRIDLINLTDIPFKGAYELLDFVFCDFPSLIHLAISHEILAWKFRYTERDSRYSKQQLAAVGPSESCTPVASLKSLRIGLYNARGTGTLDQHKEIYGPTIDHFCQIIGKYPTVLSSITSLEAHLVDGFDGLWHEFLINSQHKLKLPNLRKVSVERPDHPQGDFKFPLVQQLDLQNVTTLSLHVMLRHMCLNNVSLYHLTSSCSLGTESFLLPDVPTCSQHFPQYSNSSSQCLQSPDALRPPDLLQRSPVDRNTHAAGSLWYLFFSSNSERGSHTHGRSKIR